MSSFPFRSQFSLTSADHTTYAFERIVLCGNYKVASISISIVQCKIVYLSFKECYSWLASCNAQPANTR